MLLFRFNLFSQILHYQIVHQIQIYLTQKLSIDNFFSSIDTNLHNILQSKTDQNY